MTGGIAQAGITTLRAALGVVTLLVAGGAGAALHASREMDARQQQALPPARVLVRTGVVPRRANESSGVAASRHYAGVLWTHNDSGGKAELYAIDLAGKVLGEVKVEGAGFVDWEDIARGPCPASWGEAGDCLYIADIGDNVGARRDGTIYVVVEPDPDAKDVGVRGEFDVTYDIGAQDAEALAVDGSGNLVVVTKGRNGQALLYELSAEGVEKALASDERVTLSDGQRLPIPVAGSSRNLVTAAAFAPDGRLAVRNYLEVYFFRRAESGAWHAEGGCNFWDRNRSGEAIDFLDAEQMVVTGEWERNHPGEIFRVRCDDARD